MANHTATEKAIRKTIKKSAINKNRRTRVRTYIKKVVTAVDQPVDGVDAVVALVAAQSEMMRAVARGLIKKNTASRKISRLAKKVKLAAGVTKLAPIEKTKAKVEKVLKVAAPKKVKAENSEPVEKKKKVIKKKIAADKD